MRLFVKFFRREGIVEWRVALVHLWVVVPKNPNFFFFLVPSVWLGLPMLFLMSSMISGTHSSMLTLLVLKNFLLFWLAQSRYFYSWRYGLCSVHRMTLCSQVMLNAPSFITSDQICVCVWFFCEAFFYVCVYILSSFWYHFSTVTVKDPSIIC